MIKTKRIDLPNERILQRVINLRGERVILDVHLSELYDIQTRILKQAVRRNIDRFPEDFMFSLTREEMQLVIDQKVLSSKSNFGGAAPFAFTETGVAMLSSVLNSKRAIEMNIMIMRTFVALRKLAINYDELLLKIEEMELQNNFKFKEIYETLRYLLSPQTKRNPIGFMVADKTE